MFWTGLFAEVVVDAVDVFFSKELVQRVAELDGGFEVAAEGFFNDDAGVGATAGFGEVFSDGRKEAGWDGEVVERCLGVAQLLADLLEGVQVGVVAVDVAEQVHEFFKGVFVQAAVLFERVLGAGFEVIEVPAGLGDADDGNIEAFVLDEALQGGEDLFVGEIAGGSEEDEGVGLLLGAHAG